ncbi:hypothetical protein OPV22_002012 [Ensete ventricosum]|uniref:Uncharacterized protein n=1 Tax=Ensete ventricosum TaxID=4639 RepID=A0AAV8RWQ5_ENSVE|nr:hypothetical protein OPV22_002012 [Ensete ventricosum]
MNKSPVFPMTPEANHYSDYGFDPQMDYFQVLEEARRHSKRSDPRPLDSLHCKLQKPISKDDANKSKKRRRGWWKSAFLFWRRPKVSSEAGEQRRSQQRPHNAHRSAVSGPIYATESCCGGRRTSRPSSGPLTAAEVGADAAGLAYLSLRDLSFVDGRRASTHAAVPPAMPIYLVT